MFDTLGGRKFIICITGIVAVSIYGILKDVEAKTILDILLYLVGIGVGGIALEDGIGKFVKPCPPEAIPQPPAK